MFSANVPKYLLGEAVLIAAYLIDRMPTRILKYTTPLDCLKLVFRNFKLQEGLTLKVFGFTVYVHIPAKFRSKLEPRAEKCVFIGYASNKKGYKCCNPKTKKCMSVWMRPLLKMNLFLKILFKGRMRERKIIFGVLYLFPILEQSAANPILEKQNNLNPSLFLPCTIDSNSGGGMLQQELDFELQVYTRRKNHTKERDLPINPAQSQSKSQSDGPKNLPGNSLIPTPTSSNSNPVPNEPSDLDISIALRKGTCSCTNHPISKYLSYDNFSNNHRAFIAKISHLFVPRNIQEALDDQNWKSAVLK